MGHTGHEAVHCASRCMGKRCRQARATQTRNRRWEKTVYTTGVCGTRVPTAPPKTTMLVWYLSSGRSGRIMTAQAAGGHGQGRGGQVRARCGGSSVRCRAWARRRRACSGRGQHVCLMRRDPVAELQYTCHTCSPAGKQVTIATHTCVNPRARPGPKRERPYIACMVQNTTTAPSLPAPWRGHTCGYMPAGCGTTSRVEQGGAKACGQGGQVGGVWRAAGAGKGLGGVGARACLAVTTTGQWGRRAKSSRQGAAPAFFCSACSTTTRPRAHAGVIRAWHPPPSGRQAHSCFGACVRETQQ